MFYVMVVNTFVPHVESVSPILLLFLNEDLPHVIFDWCRPFSGSIKIDRCQTSLIQGILLCIYLCIFIIGYNCI